MIKSNVYQRLPFFYGWVILAVSFLALFATFGMRVSFGSYVTSWENEFAISRTAVTTISLISFIVVAISQPLIGKLNDRFGARTVLTGSMLIAGAALLLCSRATSLWQLVFLYGIMMSFALTGASNITATAVITRWFTAKRGLAMGITVSGMAVGQLTIVPLTLYLISQYDWRFTTGLMGFILLVVFTPLMVLGIRSKPSDIGLLPLGETAADAGKELPAVHESETESRTIWAILRQRVFWQLSIPYFICGFTDVGLVDTHFIPLTQGKGFSVGVISLAFSLIAIANIAGTIGTGYLADRLNRSRLLAFIYGVRAATLVLLLFSNQPWILMVFGLVYGITEMASIAPTSSFCAHLFQKYSIGVIFGLVSVSHQLGGAIGSFVPGILYDRTHSYVPVIIISVILLVISAAIVARIPDMQGNKLGPMQKAGEC